MEERRYLPAQWLDEERMRVLMGPMPAGPQEQVARDARHTFWAAAVHSWCSVTRKPCFTLQECQSAFRRGTQMPLCLPEVLLHMISQGEVVPLGSLALGEQEPESWLGWGRRVLVANPSQFAWNKLKQAVGLSSIQGVTLTNTRVLQEMCHSLMEVVWAQHSCDSSHSPTTEAELYRLVGQRVGTADNLHLVVEVLVAEGRAAAVVHNDTTYVKFARPGDTVRPVITQLELAESDLRSAQQRVEASVESLGQEKTSLRRQAKAALQAGSKTEALSLLRSKKRIDKSLATQLGTLENISAWLQQLQDARTNMQVLGAFRVSVEALKTAMVGESSADAAAATLDDLQQVLEECEDVNSMLAKNPAGEEDLDSLEAELDQLMIMSDPEPSEEGTGQVGDYHLPEVPKNVPLVAAPLPSL